MKFLISANSAMSIKREPQDMNGRLHHRKFDLSPNYLTAEIDHFDNLISPGKKQYFFTGQVKSENFAPNLRILSRNRPFLINELMVIHF